MELGRNVSRHVITIDDELTSNDRQWYARLKRMSNYDQSRFDQCQVEEISQLSPQDQAEAIADSFSFVSNQYKPIQKENINIPSFSKSSIPSFKPSRIKKLLEKIKTNKATAPGDIPPKILKQFASFLSVPLCDIINCSLQSGQWPKLYKTEAITPVPKQFPPLNRDMLRPISILFSFNRIMELSIGELMVEDMKLSSDPSQSSNKKQISIQQAWITIQKEKSMRFSAGF